MFRAGVDVNYAETILHIATFDAARQHVGNEGKGIAALSASFRSGK
jgi:hypothetical protein